MPSPNSVLMRLNGHILPPSCSSRFSTCCNVEKVHNMWSRTRLDSPLYRQRLPHHLALICLDNFYVPSWISIYFNISWGVKTLLLIHFFALFRMQSNATPSTKSGWNTASATNEPRLLFESNVYHWREETKSLMTVIIASFNGTNGTVQRSFSAFSL
jgi:hypothetical protein